MASRGRHVHGGCAQPGQMVEYGVVDGRWSLAGVMAVLLELPAELH